MRGFGFRAEALSFFTGAKRMNTSSGSLFQQPLPAKDRSAVVMALLTVVLYFSGVFIFLTPLPLVYLAFRRGTGAFYNPALYALAFVALAYLFGLNFFASIYERHPTMVWLLPIPSLGLVEYFPGQVVAAFGIGYFLAYLFIGWSITKALTEPHRVFRIAALSIVALFAAAVALNLVFVLPHADKLFSDYRQYVTQALEQLIALQEKADADAIELAYLKSNVDELVRYTIYLMPSFLLSSLSCLYILNLVLAKRLFAPFFPALTRATLTAFRMPFYFVWCVIALVAVFLVNVSFFDLAAAHFFTINLLVVIGTVYFFQGCAILVHFLDARGVFGIFRMGIYFMLLLFAQASVLGLASLGFFDSWMDVRKFEKRTPTNKG